MRMAVSLRLDNRGLGPVALGRAHDSTIAGSARFSIYYRVMLLSGRARDCRFVGSAAGNRKLSYACCDNFIFYFYVQYTNIQYSADRLEPNPGSGRHPAVRVVRNFQNFIYMYRGPTIARRAGCSPHTVSTGRRSCCGTRPISIGASTVPVGYALEDYVY